MDARGRTQVWLPRVLCEGARYAEILGDDSLQAVQNLTLQSESLILAQNERWRQA